ncbi:MAG TPA: PQQ-binding-like beta-propeller repeat protein [Candidatus Acidoferrum sp.]|nr:PQQ-binding-like beta-propeller repeat protein [Candidatus Acidoferrum sp.]
MNLQSSLAWMAVSAVCAPGLLTAADHPQWGQDFSRNMVSAERHLPDSLDPATGKNLKWKARLGSETHSTPVIAGGKVLIGTNNEEPRDARRQGDRSVLMCLDEKDGHLLWQLLVPKLTNSIYWDWPKAGICSPATVEGDRAYIVSNRGEVLCLDLKGLADGNDGPFVDEARHAVPAGDTPIVLTNTDADIIWAFDIIKECGVRQHDQAYGSVLIDGPFLYVNTSNGVDDTHKQIHAPDAPSLIVLEKATGRLVAKDNERIGPRIFHSTWSPPTLGKAGGQGRIFFGGGDGVLYGFEPLRTAPRPGEVVPLKRVWRFDCDPTAPKEQVHRYNSNRRESPSNIKSTPVFADGRLYVTVGGDVWWGKNQAWLQCIDAQGTGDTTGEALVWSVTLDKHSMSTPSVSGDLVFAADCGRKVYCVEARAGKVRWVQETNGEIWSSTLVADGKVYVGTCRGDFWVMAASREKKVLRTIQFDSPIHGSPVAANGVLYVTTMHWLYAFQEQNL